MKTLAETFKQDQGKSAFWTVAFINGLLKQDLSQKYLTAYSLAERREMPEITTVSESKSFLIVDSRTGCQYLFDSHSEGGMFDSEGSQTIYSSASLRRLKRRLPKNGKLNRPTHRSVFEAEVSIHESQFWDGSGEIDIPADPEGYFSVKGEINYDPFIKELYDFVSKQNT